MGTEVGRIEKEFVFKALAEDRAPCDVHGARKEARCLFHSSTSEKIVLEPVEGELPEFFPGEDVRVFFYLKNNYHTFHAKVLEITKSALTLEQPPGVYKNLQRKYERVKVEEDVEVSFTMEGRKVELNFPKSERYSPVEAPQTAESFDPRRIQQLMAGFKEKMGALVSGSKISMMRDKLPKAWEEKVIARMGKSLWIPSVEEDFPVKDPFPDERIITKADLIRIEEDSGAQSYVITGKLGNILYEKSKKGLYSELLCPILYNEYMVGYLHIWNTDEKRDKIGRDMVDYVNQFARVLCYSLVTNGYFKADNLTERRYEAPIIDMSASGLLFAHPSADLAKDLSVHTDIELTMRVGTREIRVSTRIMRKFKDAQNNYFGLLFLKIDPDDFNFLFQRLYGKPFSEEYAGIWEGGAPPPPVSL